MIKNLVLLAIVVVLGALWWMRRGTNKNAR